MLWHQHPRAPTMRPPELSSWGCIGQPAPPVGELPLRHGPGDCLSSSGAPSRARGFLSERRILPPARHQHLCLGHCGAHRETEGYPTQWGVSELGACGEVTGPFGASGCAPVWEGRGGDVTVKRPCRHRCPSVMRPGQEFWVPASTNSTFSSGRKMLLIRSSY